MGKLSESKKESLALNKALEKISFEVAKAKNITLKRGK